MLVMFFYAIVLRASRDLTAAEMALMQLLEYAAGPIVVYLAGKSAVPSPETLGGGALLLCGLAAHEALAILAEAGFAPAIWFGQSCVTLPTGPGGTGGMRATLAGSWQELRSLVLPTLPTDDARPAAAIMRNSPRNRRPSGTNVVDGGPQLPRSLDQAPFFVRYPVL